MIKNNFGFQIFGVSLLVAVLVGATASGVTLPFTENFATTASWADAAGNPVGLTLVPSGGPDGSSYVSQMFGFGPLADDDSATLFRAQDEFASSGGAFEGNWMTEGVGTFSAYVRHSLPAPANFFTRFSSPINFPGAIAVEFVPVFPNTWTEISFDISPTNPEFVSFEGEDFASVFSTVGHVQVGVNVPTGFGGNPVPWTFDLDLATVTPVPEPSHLTMLGLISSLLALRTWPARAYLKTV